MCYVYILKCADDTLYTGWTVDLHKRLEVHNSGQGAKYTRGRLPVKLMYSEKLENRSLALKREWKIKQMERDEKFKLISKD